MFKKFFRKIRDTAKKIAPIAAPIAGILTGNPYIGAGIGGLLGQYGGKEGALQGAMLGGLGGLGARAMQGNQLFSFANTPKVATNVIPKLLTVAENSPAAKQQMMQAMNQGGGGGGGFGLGSLKDFASNFYKDDKLTGLGKLGASLAPALATYFALKADKPENPDANAYRSPVDEYYAARARGENPNPADYGLAPTPEERLVGDLEQRNFNMGGLASMQSEALPMSDVMNIRQQSIMKKNPMNNLMGVANLAMGGDPMFPRRTGEIDGPGGPKDDKIPAMLSDGEFVFTAKAVENAGGPSAMYKMMNSLDPESEKPSERM
tara:strand:- start:507 stop:1466 length:960 start_codon:yes stop_codon:yes gene_type:complete